MNLNALHMSPLHGLVYANNQKAGCTSVKYSLWQDHDRRTGQHSFKGRTHDREQAPFLIGADAIRGAGQKAVSEAQVFALVRHPFTRALSAYLHHIADDNWRARLGRRFGLWRSMKLRDDFMLKVGVSPRRSLSFEGFLEALQAHGPEGLTGHFRRQLDNILWPEVRFHHVARLEQLQGLHDFLAGHNVHFTARIPHAQKADAKRQAFATPRALRLVQDIYAADFEAFGYADAEIRIAGEISAQPESARSLQACLWPGGAKAADQANAGSAGCSAI